MKCHCCERKAVWLHLQPSEIKPERVILACSAHDPDEGGNCLSYSFLLERLGEMLTHLRRKKNGHETVALIRRTLLDYHSQS